MYRSGVLAVLLLFMALVSGVYLLFFYSISRPYESMLEIQQNPWFVGWVRSFHRYVSDGVVIAVVVHVARLVVEGKTWGPRFLAWIMGIVLLLLMAVSAWTGFVLVWDEAGQKLAVTGAKILRSIPIFQEPPDRIFVGEKPMASQFFFLNIFIHMSVPLAMILFLWLHTSRLARPGWFPEKKVIWSTLGAFIALSLIWPAPLTSAGNLLSVPGTVATDWFYNFWLPWAENSPGGFLLATLGVLTLGLLAPVYCRPFKARKPPSSYVDPKHCEGCQQCYVDCPYDAIEMVPGINPEKYPLRANVLSDQCVSCGICAGSCSSLAIGPEARTAKEQLAVARELVKTLPQDKSKKLIVACQNNRNLWAQLQQKYSTNLEYELSAVSCTGSLHPGTISYLAGHAKGLLILSCPFTNCVHREGSGIVDERMLKGRNPAVLERFPTGKVLTLHKTAGEWSEITASIANWQAPPASDKMKWLGSLVATFFFMALIALGSSYPQGAEYQDSMLRLGWRLTGQVHEECRTLNAEEVAKLPVHMRKPLQCSTKVLAYMLKAEVDGKIVIEKVVSPAGLRADRPLLVQEEFAIAPGEHEVEVSFLPVEQNFKAKEFRFKSRVDFQKKKVHLVTYQGENLVSL